MNKFDDIDTKILRGLVVDAGQSVPKLSEKIQVNPSATYSRIKRLAKRGLIRKFIVKVNEELLGWKVLAYVGVNTDAKKRDAVLQELLKEERVREVAEVTGRFDFLVTIKAKSLEELHNVVTSRIGNIEGSSTRRPSSP